VLDDLNRDVMLCRDRCDWVAKKFLLDTFMAEEKVGPDHPWLQSLDLEYHNVDIDDGLHHALVRDGQMLRFLAEEEIRNAIFMPPDTTRAFFRGRAVARYQPEIVSIHWDEVVFQHRGERHPVSLNQAFNDAELSRLNGLMNDSRSLGDLLAALEQRPA
jgi:proteasome accessory factor A